MFHSKHYQLVEKCHTLTSFCAEKYNLSLPANLCEQIFEAFLCVCRHFSKLHWVFHPEMHTCLVAGQGRTIVYIHFLLFLKIQCSFGKYISCLITFLKIFQLMDKILGYTNLEAFTRQTKRFLRAKVHAGKKTRGFGTPKGLKSYGTDKLSLVSKNSDRN